MWMLATLCAAVIATETSMEDLHKNILHKFDQCNWSTTKGDVDSVVVTQDGTGGGGIGNLMLKIKYVVALLGCSALAALTCGCIRDCLTLDANAHGCIR